jgi:hypothetical protein
MRNTIAKVPSPPFTCPGTHQRPHPCTHSLITPPQAAPTRIAQHWLWVLSMFLGLAAVGLFLYSVEIPQILLILIAPIGGVILGLSIYILFYCCIEGLARILIATQRRRIDTAAREVEARGAGGGRAPEEV